MGFWRRLFGGKEEVLPDEDITKTYDQSHLRALGIDKVKPHVPRQKKALPPLEIGCWVRVAGTDNVGEVKALFGRNGTTAFNGTEFAFIKFGSGVFEAKSYRRNKLEKLG